MNRIMRNSGAALAAIFIAGSLTACGPGSASSSRSDTNPTEVSTDLGNKKYELTLWDGAGLKAVDEALIAGFEAKYPNITITGQYDPDNVSGQNGPRVISAKDAPDIARVTDMNSAVRGNHLEMCIRDSLQTMVTSGNTDRFLNQMQTEWDKVQARTFE